MGGSTRVLAVLVAALAVALPPAAGTAAPRGKTAPTSRLQLALLGQINAFRTAHGLARLRLARGLVAAANGHSTQMTQRGFFSHDSANGGSFSQRIARYYPARGYGSWSVGENLVWGGPDIGAAQAFRLWLASPPHRANLLSPRWREIGLGAVHSTSAPGVYGGRPATVVTADFGTRSR